MLNNASIPLAATSAAWQLPSRRKAAVAWLIVTESAMFTIFVIAYLFYLGKSLTGPSPAQVLETPIISTLCLLGSSLTIMWAAGAFRRAHKVRFRLWWALTIGLAAVFLAKTATEWYRLITVHHLTIRTNLFGTTFYALVGLHATHVIVGVILLTLVLALSLAGKVRQAHAEHLEMVAWYWHFVDAVWVVVFTVVYVIGR
jgi:cytochrome c oxidase subunit 3/cytochrome o ubiquinol oxidase subunit 3